MKKAKRSLLKRQTPAPEYTMTPATRAQYNRGRYTVLLAELRKRFDARKVPHAIPAVLPGETKKG